LSISPPLIDSRRVGMPRDPPGRGPNAVDQALPAHFLKMTSHCCAANFTESSALN